MENLRFSRIRKQFQGLKFEEFPVKLFFRLLQMDDRVPEVLLGQAKWQRFKAKWEDGEKSLESKRLLEDQKRTMLPLMKAQKAAMALRWLAATNSDDAKEKFEEWNLPWEDDPKKLVETIKRFIQKNVSQHENNLIQLKVTREAIANKQNADFTIEDGIATLNLAGFTVIDPEKLTIGQYKSYNKTIERNGKGAA